MTPIASQALAITLAVAQAPAAAPVPVGPPLETPSVVVTARRPVVVTGTDWCPEPKPARYPADHDPQVVDSFPRDGARLAPGFVQVRVTFDAPMSCYGEVTLQGGPQDPCEPEGVWVEPDRRSFLLRCRLARDARYTLRFARREGPGFVGLSGRAAQPFVLGFATTDAAPVAAPDLAARDDSGPPGARRATAYVACADRPAGAPGDDCRHQRLKPPS